MKPIPIYLVLMLFWLVAPQGATSQQLGSSREPFVLELPGISNERFTLPVVRVAAREVASIRIRVLEPFAESIKYGDIIVTLNGDGVNRGCTKTRDLQGKVVECGRREDRLGGYSMLPGKNVLELKALDTAGKEYYASFVIMLGENPSIGSQPISRGPVEKFSGRKFAIILGVSEYKYNDAGLKNLDFADDDARSISEFLRSPEGGSFLPADIRLLIDRDASLIALRASMSEVAKRAGPNDLVFIFIAGHGAPDPFASQNLYFLFYDTKVVDMRSTAFPMDELKLFLDTRVLAQRVFVMIDTCHSAGVNLKTQTLVTGRQLLQAGDENNISNFYMTKQLFKEKGRSILTSSGINEVSRESEKWGNHGVFTWALLEGLKGKADSNKDGMVTTGEVFEFTRDSVQRATNFEQNPIALPGSATNVVMSVVKQK